MSLSMQKIQETHVQSLGQEDPLEENIATHSSILACEISWTENPQSMRSQRVGHYWACTCLCVCVCVCLCVYIYIYMCVCVCVCVCNFNPILLFHFDESLYNRKHLSLPQNSCTAKACIFLMSFCPLGWLRSSRTHWARPGPVIRLKNTKHINSLGCSI